MQKQQETNPLLAPVGEQLYKNYQLHDLPTVSKKDEEHTYYLTQHYWQESRHWNLKTKS